MRQKHPQSAASLLEANILKQLTLYVPQSCDHSKLGLCTNVEFKNQPNQYKKTRKWLKKNTENTEEIHLQAGKKEQNQGLQTERIPDGD